MSDPASGPVGQTLRDAREAQGLGVDDVAARLRLMRRQIEAMEADDFDSLGQPVFARGFVRNYARLLGLAPDPLLADMGGATAEPVVMRPEAPLPSRNWLTSPWLLLALFGVAVLAVVPVALYWWLNSDEDEVPVGATRAPAVAPATPAAADTVPVEPPVAAEAPTTPEAVPTVPAVQDAGAVAADETPSAVAPVVRGVLQLEFGADSWVEIRDATGRMLHRQLDTAGSSIEVRGEPPFDVVVGNAAQVRMTYNGRPIDLKPFIDVTVARFTLEE
ncbi:MAG: helix-turn-helix domain-containing protein [Thiobacillus sp. 65-29]|nr:MAG: helix-turn-helix domain-containing protein [Thiobacillus sp. 65-29]